MLKCFLLCKTSVRNYEFCDVAFADVAELADALVSGSSEAIHVGSSPVVRTNKKSTALAVELFMFIRTEGVEIGRKLRSNLSEGPNSPVECLSAKAATGGSPVIRTK